MAFPSVKRGNKVGEVAKKPMPGVPLNEDDIERLLRYYHGNISRVADKLGTCRGTVRRRIDNSPHLSAVKTECRERFIDDLEECSWHKALNGDTIMQLFLLKTIGKARGYDQDNNQNASQDLVKAAFEFVINRTQNPAIQCEPSIKPTPQLELA